MANEDRCSDPTSTTGLDSAFHPTLELDFIANLNRPCAQLPLNRVGRIGVTLDEVLDTVDFQPYVPMREFFHLNYIVIVVA